MSVRPDDLANVCALFTESGRRQIPFGELKRLVSRSLPLEAEASAEEIIQEARKCGLLASRGDACHITKIGSLVGAKQAIARQRISNEASKVLIYEVYLNSEARDACCAGFLQQFRPDPPSKTFIFERETNETPETLQWLMTLTRVGLIRCDGHMAYVEERYLQRVNEMLAKIRGSTLLALPGVFGKEKEVGDVAEELAIKWEKKRLHSNGLEELIPLIQHISTIDQTAGYDVLSCGCIGKSPEARIYIEVKGTRGKRIRFIWSRNERLVAKEKGESYWIYCFTEVDLKNRSGRGPFRIRNPFRKICPPEYIVEATDVEVRKA